jgi:hypothetical protein
LADWRRSLNLFNSGSSTGASRGRDRTRRPGSNREARLESLRGAL